MNRIPFLIVLAALPAAAQPAGKPMTPQAVAGLARRIQREVIMLPNYGVFDDIRFSIQNYEVTVKGVASRPTLKDSVERVVKKVEGVEKVINRIEVLPLSPHDDGIRARLYGALYGHQALARYNPNRGVPVWLSPARLAVGITNDPPPGFHPIRLIVRNGNVTLTGVVDNEADKNIAGIVANTVSGVFSVENDLAVASESRPIRRK